MQNKNYEIHTDLALERYKADTKDSGVRYNERNEQGITVSELEITDEKSAKEQGIPIGKYTTLCFESLDEMQLLEQENLSKVLSQTLKGYALSCSKKEKIKDMSVLIAGLGNRYLTADAIGPLSIKYITATSHISEISPDIFKSHFGSRISLISPGVMSQTGLETSYIIKSICRERNFDLVIAIDSLAARSCDRLATTIQLCNTGITPGSGIGNSREALNEKSLGVPTVAIGVPTVVKSSTLVYDALKEADITSISEKLQKTLDSGKSFYVTPKDSDTVSENAAKVISGAINNLFNAELYI